MKMYWSLALTGLLLVSPAALAGTVHVHGNTANSTTGLGDFTATLDYTAADATHGTLTVTLTNTTPSAGGYITGFVLNNPGDAITGITITDPELNLLGGPTFNNSVNGGPFGQFDFGISTFTSFEGGGDPSDGIPVGETGSVVLALTGSNLDLIDAIDFTGELSVPPGDGHGHEFMVVRFRGMDDPEGGDKVPANGGHHNPEPSTLLLALLGVTGVPLWRAYRR